MLVSQAKENKNWNAENKENIADDYKLFSNIIKKKEESTKVSKQEIEGKRYFKNEYFDILKIEKKESKPLRPPSRQKIQQYFSDASMLIRPKSNSSKIKL